MLAAVADQRLGCPVLAHRREQHDQEGGQVLGAGEGAGHDGAAVVLQDRDAVDVAAAELVVEVAQVDRPVLVPTVGLEGHRLRLVRLALGPAQAIELPIPGQDPPAGAGAQLDPQLHQRGMDPELAQLGVDLELADRVHRRQVGLPGRVLGASVACPPARDPFLDPALQRRVDRRRGGLQIARDAGDVPALGMQPDDRRAAARPDRRSRHRAGSGGRPAAAQAPRPGSA